MTTLTPAAAVPPPEAPPDQPGWARPALLALLAGTALLYLWDLGASGYANSFYAAAVQAGTMSWKAMFFGSFDPANFITVDKPPASLWVMSLSGRIFGFNSWSMLVPQALEGVAAVALLYAAVRRWFGPAAGLLAGAALALTPAAALMFRYNNPDALLTLLLVAGAYCVVRATERASTRWLLLAGTAVGFGFLTKMLQAFLVVPAFGLVYLVAAPTSLRRRLVQLLGAAGAVVASAGWWVALVELWPASARPYIGGSTNNSVLELAFGYNGLSRILGGEGPASGGGGGAGGESLAGAGGGSLAGGSGLPTAGGGQGAGFGGASGIFRLFHDDMGVEVSWLLPAALLALAVGLWLTRRAPRTDRTRAALLLWGGWLLVTGLVFSYMQGIVHPYYTVALAPSIAAVVAITGRELWHRRDTWLARIVLALMIAGTGSWSFALLNRTPDWYPALRYAIGAVAVLAVIGLLVSALVGERLLKKAVLVTLTATLVGGFAGTTAYAWDTAATAHDGPIPSAGPAATAGPGAAGGAPQGVRRGPAAGAGQRPGSGQPPADGQAPPDGQVADGNGPDGGQVVGGGQAVGAGQVPDAGQVPGSRAAAGASTDPALAALLKATTTPWAAATIGSQNAASLQLSSGRAVMSIGGFSGGDPAPSLAQFQRHVADGKIRYFISGGPGGPGSAGGRGAGGAPGGPGGRAGGGSEITSWVQAHFASTTVGGQTVYDLSLPTTTGS